MIVLFLRISDKPINFEISLGNAGNSLDGQTQSSASQNEDGKGSHPKKKRINKDIGLKGGRGSI